MKKYKQQLLHALEQSRWELVEVIGPADWWSQEHWRLRRRDEPGREVFLSFLVDPHTETGRPREPLIAAVCATLAMPRERPIGRPGDALGWLQMMKGQFGPKLEAFVKQLDGSGGETG